MVNLIRGFSGLAIAFLEALASFWKGMGCKEWYKRVHLGF